MKKRIVSFILTLCMALSLTSAAVFAATDYDAARDIVKKSKSQITVTNDTDEDSLTSDLQALIPDGNPCTVRAEIVTKVNATTEKKGSIMTKVYVTDPVYNYTNSGDTVIYSIPVARQDADEVYSIDDDVKEVKEAFEAYISSVTVTKDNILSQKKEILKAAENAVKNGSDLNWLGDPIFSTGMPKDGKNGYIRGTLKITLGAEIRTAVLDAVIYANGSAAINNGENADPVVEPTTEPDIEPVPTAVPIEPAEPVKVTSIPDSGIAHPSTQIVNIDGNKATFEMYALLDSEGNPTNYIKVRDLAFALNGTSAQFEVDWNGAVNIISGVPYTTSGSENNTPFSGEREYTVPQNPTNVNGAASDLTAIFLIDDNGGGYTYYQLRDLGKKLGFNVGWDSERGIFIETDKPYQN